MIYLLFALHKRCPTLIPSSVVFGGGRGGCLPGGRQQSESSKREVEEVLFSKRNSAKVLKVG